jgi:tetratricopeptide (TPR) repeat protein
VSVNTECQKRRVSSFWRARARCKAGRGLVLAATVALALVLAGCGKKEVSELARKQADHFAAEAEFAITLRDWARAEGLLAQAAALVPGNGVVWTNLGSVRVRLNNKSAAREAYLKALKAYEDEAAADKAKADPEPWLKQVYVLALLGRTNDARALLEKTARQFPGHRNVKAFVERKQFDAMLADPNFKQAAL